MNLFSIEFQQPTDCCITINYPLDRKKLKAGHWSLVTGHWSLVTGH